MFYARLQKFKQSQKQFKILMGGYEKFKKRQQSRANKNLYARLQKFKIFMRDYENSKFLCEIMKIETRAETT